MICPPDDGPIFLPHFDINLHIKSAETSLLNMKYRAELLNINLRQSFRVHYSYL